MHGLDSDMVFVRKTKDTVSLLKLLVAYFKRSGLNNKLSSALVQCCDTRWNSVFLMLQSLVKVYAEVQNVLTAEAQEQRLLNIDISVVKILINFLLPFYEATKDLEGDHYAIIHHVYQWFVKLQRCMQTALSDCPMVKFLRALGSFALKSKIEIVLFHKVGLFLNPKFKALLPFNSEEKKQVMDYTSDLSK